MKKLFLLTLLMPLSLFSQKDSLNSYSLTVEPQLFRNAEELIITRKNSSSGYLFRFEWQHAKKSQIHRLSLSTTFSRPKNEYEPAHVSFWISPELKYTYLHSLKPFTFGSLFLGANFQAEYQIAYYALWDDSHMYWADFWGIGLSSFFEKIKDDRKAYFASFEFPLFGGLSRPPVYRDYKMDETSAGGIMESLHQEIKPVTFLNYINPALSLGVRLKYSDHFSNAFYYHFEYIKADLAVSKPYKQLQHGIGITFIF